MFESRCGVECTKCEKYGNSCNGCTKIDKPVWGECKVKTCCEERAINHCGECDVFPCKMLQSKGLAFGFDPLPNIERCRKWAKEEQDND